jgi:hypothetical protein
MAVKDIVAGAEMFLRTAGVADENLRRQLLQRVQQQALEKSQMDLQREQAFQTAIPGIIQSSTTPAQEGAYGYGPMQEGQFNSDKAIPQMMPFLTPEQGATALLNMGAKESPTARLMRELMVAQVRSGTSANKPTNMPPWYDALAVEKLGSAYDTPEGKKQFADYMATTQGMKEAAAYRTKYATETATPFNVFTQTAEGIVPGNARTGTLGEPTGLGKPIPAGEAAKMGDLGTLLTNISEVKKLYKYGTDKENSKWVGPLSGRVGALEEKYTGTASDNQVKFYSFVRDMKDALLRARSGAQINEQEYKRLVTFLPDENLPSSSFKARLDRFEQEVNIILSHKKAALKEGGYGKNFNQNPMIEGISKEPRTPSKNNDPLGIR